MKHLIVYIILLSATFSYAQNEQFSLDLEKKADVVDIVTIGDQGFLIKTAVTYAKKERNVKIHSFTADLKKRWTLNLEKPTNKYLHYTLLASPYSPLVYYIETVEGNDYAKTGIDITRIDSLGKKTVIKYDFPKEFSRANRVAMFADEGALYILNSEVKVASDKDIKKKKAANKKESVLVFYVMKNSKKVMERFVTDIKLTSDDKDADLFVEYLGHDEENIFLSRKSVDLPENKISYEVITLDKSFNNVDVTNFEVALKNPLVPALNSRAENGASIYNNDYDVTVVQRGNLVTTTYYANAGSFGCAQLDVLNGHFYIYGLTGAKPSGKDAKKDAGKMLTKAEGGFICKFDFNTGVEKSKTEFNLASGFTSDTYFSDPYLFINRSIWLDVLSDNTYKFCGLSSSVDLHAMIVSKQAKTEYVGIKVEDVGSSSDSHRKTLINLLGSRTYFSDDHMRFMKNYKEFRTKEYSIFGILLGDRTVVIKNTAYSEDPKLEFNLFRHKE